MKIFRLSKDSEDKDKINRATTSMRLEPQPVSQSKSGVTTSPLDRVTFILKREKYFKYLNWIFSARVTFCTSSTSFYASQIGFPTETQLIRAINK
jgi:hypothetical protein